MNSIGVMQGRLTPPNGRGIQFFPFENWEGEFRTAREIGLDEIELIFDYDNYEQNPLWTKDGVKAIKRIIRETGVRVNSVCLDYFMRRPFFKSQNTDLRTENEVFIERILSSALELGVSMAELPLVDGSSIKTKEEKALLIDFITRLTDKTDMTINLETDIEPEGFVSLLDSAGRKNVKANYDSGNSAGLGYDLYKEVTVLNVYVANIHIKDKEYNGATKPLGTGSADFDALFNGLKDISYQGSFILQAARGEDGRETETVKSQLDFLRRYINKYLTDAE